MTAFDIRSISLEETLDLRRRVLRSHMPGDPAVAPTDHDPSTWHLGAFEGDRLVGVVSGFAEDAPGRPGVSAERFRWMAVDPARSGRGAGRALMSHVVEEARRKGRRLLWAHGRDTALGFYSALGFHAVGDAFIDPPSMLSHHVVVLEL